MKREAWTVLAYALAASFALFLLYLGLRPGGRLPILAWKYGLQLLPLVAFALLLFGTLVAFRKRPFLRPGRKLPFLLLLLLIGAGGLELPYPTSHEGRPSSVCFRLPFDAPAEGEWTVFWGGETRKESLLSAYTASRRFGLDLVVTKNGRSSNDGRALVTGLDILAPCDGEVVRADGPVVLRVAEREFLFLGNLEAGSIAVRPGQTVRSGDFVGRVGSSGTSPFTPEPHLEIHLQDSPEEDLGEPIPWRFCDYVADGQVVEKGLPRGGIGPDGSFLGQRIAPRSRGGKTP